MADGPRVRIEYPEVSRNRGMFYWLRPANWWGSRKKFLRRDESNRWRYDFTTDDPPPADRSTPFDELLRQPAGRGFRFVILADTGEGDRSQYGVLPLLHALEPDFLIINGDVAYPAGNNDDFEQGFFEPYRDMQIPIWATPGNHEYYSSKHGTEFFEHFCTRVHARKWERFGLRLVQQPGTFWELRQDGVPFVVLGVDSGKKGNLDGVRRPSWLRSPRPDTRQHAWLDDRLREAARAGLTALVLFHIPALVNRHHADKIHLDRLHRILAAYDNVRVVVTGHEHSYQQYDRRVFTDYLRDRGSTPRGRAEYVVSGGGGAFLSRPPAPSETQYPARAIFPDGTQWGEYAGIIMRASDLGGFWDGLTSGALGDMLARFNEGAFKDADVARYLSLLLVDVPSAGELAKGARPRLVPYFLDDVENLFRHLPAGTVVRVERARQLVDMSAVDRMAQRGLAIEL